MADFPTLKTGVTAQYPSDREFRFSTEIRRFVDGGEQRYRDFRGHRKRWVIRLSQLDESERASLLEFYMGEQGRLGTFDFEDPWSGVVLTGCRFERDSLVGRVDGEFDSSAEIVVLGPSAPRLMTGLGPPRQVCGFCSSNGTAQKESSRRRCSAFGVKVLPLDQS